MTTRIRFFGLSDEKLYYDERKKRFVFLEDAPNIAERAFKNTHFKSVFPSNFILLAKTRSVWLGVR